MGLFISCCCDDNECNACSNELQRGNTYTYNGKNYCSNACKTQARTRILRRASFSFPT